MSNTVEMEVVLPMTHAGVRDLLCSLSRGLKRDAKRYMKKYKYDESEPLVQDKLQWAKGIDRLVKREVSGSRKRWNSG